VKTALKIIIVLGLILCVLVFFGLHTQESPQPSDDWLMLGGTVNAGEVTPSLTISQAMERVHHHLGTTRYRTTSAVSFKYPEGTGWRGYGWHFTLDSPSERKTLAISMKGEIKGAGARVKKKWQFLPPTSREGLSRGVGTWITIKKHSKYFPALTLKTVIRLIAIQYEEASIISAVWMGNFQSGKNDEWLVTLRSNDGNVTEVTVLPDKTIKEK